jgi:hypothetical protein
LSSSSYAVFNIVVWRIPGIKAGKGRLLHRCYSFDSRIRDIPQARDCSEMFRFSRELLSCSKRWRQKKRKFTLEVLFVRHRQARWPPRLRDMPQREAVRSVRFRRASQHRRFCSAATIRSARRPTAFVASRNMGYHGNAERLLPRLRSKAHERI